MKKLPIFIFFIITLLFVSIKPASATVLFQDDFNDGDANGWQVEHWTPDPTNPVWQSTKWVVNTDKQYGITLNNRQMRTFSSAGDISWTNYIYKVQMLGKSGIDKNIVFRYRDKNNWYGLHLVDSSVYFGMNIDGNYSDVVIGNYSFENNVPYDLKIIIRENSISFYANNVSIRENYIMGKNPLVSGKIALYVSTGEAYPSSVWFDNVVVCDAEPCEPTPTTTPTSTPTPTPLPVPYLSQKSEPWGSQEYNQASLWSTNPTISRWGCALTSAAMTLLYHGINKIPGGANLDPGSLNTWLKNQVDGYLREGHLNWYALTRLARIVHEEIGSTLLQFRRAGKDFNLLNDDLANNHPPILEEPGHFIVATGKTNGSYFINDPAWTEKTTLASYGDDFNSLRRLLPTTTDLSALLLVSEPNVNLTMTGPASAESYFQGPLVDDIDGGQTNGEGLGILDLPQPPEGTYTISVSGPNPTSFNLDIYSYDQGANPAVFSFFGFTNPSNPATFRVTITENGQTEEIQRTPSFARTKQDILESQQKGLITNPVVSKTLLTKITFAERLKNRSKVWGARVILKDFLRELEIYKNRFIKEPAYTLLKQDVEYLLSQL